MASEDDDIAAIENAQASDFEKAAPTSEIGVTGLKVWGGVVSQEEFLRQLAGVRGVRVYREMSDNDATVGALLAAVELMLRPIEWNVEAVDETGPAQDAAEFVKTVLDDMSHTFGDFIAECLTFLIYGWSYFETVYKRRVGPDERDPAKRSKYTDGKIGIRKLAPRAQDTLDHWEMQDDGGITGMWQVKPQGGERIFLPIEKSLLFRTTSRKNNPEGRSVLRNAYRSWFLMKNAQEYESIGIERELCGMPYIKVPNATLTDATASAAKNAYITMARDLKFNEQGGVVVPSDPWKNPDGTYSSMPMVEVKLLTSGGQRSINTDATITRYQRDIARSVLADFLMLGTDGRGSYALSTDKTDLFLRAVMTFAYQICDPFNRFQIPRLWELNGMDRDLMPKLMPGQIAPKDLEKLGAYLERLARIGMPLFPDDNLSSYLRSEGGLPDEDAMMLDDNSEEEEPLPDNEPQEQEQEPEPEPEENA
jgi:hypothetical protein